MKKFSILLICFALSASAGFSAWQQIVPGYYMDNYSQKGKVLKGSYKYTTDYAPFREDMKLIPQAQKLNVASFTQDVILDCGTKQVRMTNMVYYNKEGKAVFKVPEDITGGADPELMKACKQAGL